MRHRILVTGGAGYIGSHCVLELLQQGFQVVVVDNLELGHAEAVPYQHANCELVKADITASPTFHSLESHTFDAVLHFAAYSQVGESMQQPEKYYRNNVFGTLNLLDFCQKQGVQSFILSSTSEVYGEAQYLPLDEDHQAQPMNPYGKSKYMAEQMLESFDRVYGLKYVSLRYFNAAGASLDGSIGEDHRPETHLIPNAILGALGSKPFQLTCSRVDTPDGTTIRDYVHVVDLAKAHVAALKYLLGGGKSECINLGTGKGYSVKEVLQAVEKVTGVSFVAKSGETRVGEPAAKYASNGKAKELLNWEPTLGLDQMIQSAYQWFKQHPEGYPEE